MQSAAFKLFVEHKLITYVYNKNENYFFHKTQNCRLNIGRFIRRDPYWLSTTSTEIIKQKTIIFNDWRALFPAEHEIQQYVYFWDYLKKENFTILINTSEGTKVVQSYQEILSNLELIKLLSNEEIEKNLIAAGEDVNQYYIVDHEQGIKLVNAFKLFICNGSEDVGENSKQVVINSHALKPGGKKLLCDMAAKQWVDSWKFITKQITFIINQEFTERELPIFLSLLEDIKLLNDKSHTLLEFMLEPIIASKIKVLHFHQHFDSNTFIDFSFFPALKQLAISTPSINNLLNLPAQLEELMLNSLTGDVCLERLSLKANCLVRLPCLKKLSLSHAKLDELNLDDLDCNQLEEVSLREQCVYVGKQYLNLSSFKNIKRLELNLKTDINEVPGLSKCIHLEELVIATNGATIHRLDLSGLINLKSLTIEGCIDQMIGFSNLFDLKKIKFNGLGVGIDVDLTNQVKAETIEIKGRLHHLFLPKKPQLLHTLSISNFDKNFQVADLLDMPRLRKLHCRNIETNFSVIENCIELEEMYLNGIQTLCKLDISRLSKLDNLSIIDCKALKEIQGWESRTYLPYTIFSGNELLEINDNIEESLKKNRYLIPALYAWEKYGVDFGDSLPSVYLNIFHQVPRFDLDSNSGASSDEDNPLLLQTDIDTYTSPNENVSPDQLFEQDIFVGYYRQIIYDNFHISKEGIVCLQPADFTKDMITETIPEGVDGKRRGIKGVAPKGLLQNQYMVLPGLSSNDKLISISPANKLNLYYSHDTQQYIVSLKKDAGPFVPTISFEIQPDPLYFKSVIYYPRILLVSILPDQLIKPLRNILLNQIGVDLKLIETTRRENFNRIIEYCRAFINDDPKDTVARRSTISDVNGFIEMIKRQRGSCRHKAMACLALCLAADIKARIVANGCHMFCEIAFENGKWVAFDLGGAKVELNIKPNPHFKKPVSIFEEKLKLQPETKKTNNITIPLTGKPINKVKRTTPVHTKKLYDWAVLFLPEQNKLNQCSTFSEMFDFLLANEKPSLLRVALSEDAWVFHRLIYQHTTKLNVPMIYINSAKDICQLFETEKIENSKEIKVDGPLKKLITLNGVLVVNWSNFNPNQRAVFKSIMDTPPTLHGMSINPSLKIIGLMQKDIETNDIFLSRCDNYNLPVQLSFNRHRKNKPTWFCDSLPETNYNKVDLYHSAEWSSFLVETISINNKIIVEAGPLIKAMLNGQAIHIMHPPVNNKEFDYFWHRLATENTALFNGEWIKAKPGFAVLMDDMPEVLKAPNNISFNNRLEEPLLQIEVTPENYYQLFEVQSITENGCIETSPGLLHSINSRNQFVFREQLAADQWSRLFDYIQKYCPLIKFNFAVFYEIHGLAINLCIDKSEIKNTNSHSLEKLLEEANHSTSIATNDPEFVVKKLQNKLHVPSKNLFYTTTDDIWSQYIESVGLTRDQGKIIGSRKELRLLKQLKAGKTVILSGDLSTCEMKAITSLMQENTLFFINGNWIEIKGKLIWVHSQALKDKLERMPVIHYKCQKQDYYDELCREIKSFDETTWNKVETLLTAIKYLNTNDDKYPSHKLLSYEKIKQLYNAIHNQDKLQAKAALIYHYRKNSEHYIYLNVLVKMVTSNEAHEGYNTHYEKLNILLGKTITDAEFERLFWKILNCLDGHTIQSVYSELTCLESATSGEVPRPSKSSIDKLKRKLKRINANLMTKIQEPRLTRQKNKLSQALLSDSTSLICLLGEAGTGKTYTATKIVKKLKSIKLINFYKSESQIVKWLSDNQKSAIKLLLLDEANMQEPGKWEFLSGLFASPPVIYYQGKKYRLESHKVILTGNPVHFAKRHFHNVIWEHAHIIWFGQFEEVFLKSHVHKKLASFDLSFYDIERAAKIIVSAFFFILNQTLRAVDVTLRDINNICFRINMLKVYHPEIKSINVVAQIALWDELSGILLDQQSKLAFKNYLISQTGGDSTDLVLAKKLPKNSSLVITKEKYQLWRVIEDALFLRQERIKAGNNKFCKLGFLLEGASGIGKSFMSLRLLEYKGFSQNAKDPQNRFIQITAGSKDIKKHLLDAFHNGSIVILDELNLDHEIEELMLQLLTGSDLSLDKARNPGFLVFTSQNPSKNLGCSNLSRAYLNRLHFCLMEEYSDAELLQIAKRAAHPEPENYLLAYKHKKSEYPLMINTRSFFAKIKLRPNDFQNDQLDDACGVKKNPQA